jgi:hypothetical protein
VNLHQGVRPEENIPSIGCLFIRVLELKKKEIVWKKRRSGGGERFERRAIIFAMGCKKLQVQPQSRQPDARKPREAR